MKEEYEITMLDTIEYRFKVDKETRDKFDIAYQVNGGAYAFEELEKISSAEEGGITHCDYQLNQIKDLTA